MIEPAEAKLARAPTLNIQETYGAFSNRRVWRRIGIGRWDGPRLVLPVHVVGETQDSLRSAWDQAWLRGAYPTPLLERNDVLPRQRALRIVDLFCGCGAMSLGLKMAAESLGMRFEVLLAADLDRAALDVYRQNLAPRQTVDRDLSRLVDFDLASEGSKFKSGPRFVGRHFAELSGRVDVLVGGPPCQGHSDLNNHSRRDDPKNSLYLVMAAMAVMLDPAIVIIENVPAVIHDHLAVVDKTRRLLSGIGYTVSEGIVPMAQLGIAQLRKRHVLVATRWTSIDIDRVKEAFDARPRSVSWAIGDLSKRGAVDVFNTASAMSVRNRERVDWMFKNGAYDLPNRKRPTCHRDKRHSYVSMYGRLRWNEPAQTVTTGFTSPGQGRYVHPSKRRTITPHEAARLQFFPDSFGFRGADGYPSRSKLALMIGNAAPPKLTYVLGVSAITSVLGFAQCPEDLPSRRPE